MKKILFVCLLALINHVVLAQNNFTKKEQKKLKKVQKLVDKKEYSKALEVFEPVINEHLLNKELWQSYASLAYMDYQQSGYLADQLFNNIKITSTDKDGNEIENDTLAQQLLSLLQGNKPGETKLLNILALGNNCIFDLEQAAIIARIYGVDAKLKIPYSDNEDALMAFKKAETAFGKKDYGDAAKYYREAIKYDSNFYKANLYLGDALYAQDQPYLALPYYKKAASMQPFLLEPKKYLTDAYIKAGELDEALFHCIDALITYPGTGMFLKLETIAYRQGKAIDFHWVPMPLLPNNIDKEQNDKLDNPWKFYREAKEQEDIKNKTSKLGIITNHPSKIEYLEVYSWHYMLDNIKKEDYPEFEFAFQMKEEGYLDCYVLFSLFNINLYSQYQHFASKNKEKIEKYMNTYILQ